MNNLPYPLILEILTRLSDSSDLARCRLTCKTLNSLSYDVTTIHIFCTYARYSKTRAHPTSTTPFKSVVTRLITQLAQLDSVSLGVDDSLSGLAFDDVEDEENDLHLTDVGFVSGWLSPRFKRLSFVDFWVQSCWRRSNVLSLISHKCQRLNELEVKNAWLSVEGLSPMSSLTSLTLEFVRIDDENLSRLNECFPCLKILNLLGVGGLENPKICLKHLESCQWTISNAPLSLTIVAPELVKLKLKCVRPSLLVLEAPKLSDFHLTLGKAAVFKIEELRHLKKLQLESPHLRDIIQSCPCSGAVNELSLDSVNGIKLVDAAKPDLDLLFDVFPNLSSLKLGPSAYTEMEASFLEVGSCERIGMNCLKDFTAHLVVSDIDVTLSFISFLMDKCSKLSAISLLVHQELDPVIANKLFSKCVAICSKVKWKWGFWKEGSEDVWVSNAI